MKKGTIYPNTFKVGDKVEATSNTPLPGNDYAPPLKTHEYYSVEDVYKCECGQEHLHVGVPSKLNYVSCYNCEQQIPRGDVKHWCHPSRFIIAPSSQQKK